MKYRFLALGDSYTIGECVQPTQCWPQQLAEMLRVEGIAVAEPQVIAATGWTTADLLAGIDRAGLLGPFHLVSLLIGVNNQYQGRDEAEYEREFSLLLDRALRFVGGSPSRVMVLSIPNWGVTSYAAGRDREQIAAEIRRFNSANRRVAQQADARYADVHAISIQASYDSSLLAVDGLHPSGKMYRRWAELILPMSRAAIVSSPNHVTR